jgi:ribosome biogenesis protein Nip4
MIQIIKEFASRLGARIDLDERLILKQKDRYFLAKEDMKKLMLPNFYYAGSYLGKVKNGRFFPSFIMLSLFAQNEANKVVLNRKTEWLFICGRDIFREGIVSKTGSQRQGEYTLVLDDHGECIGFGLVMRNLDRAMKGAVIKNISDIGDFLRREK